MTIIEATARAIKDAIGRIQTSNTGYIRDMQELRSTLSNRLLARISEDAAHAAVPLVEAATLERAAKVLAGIKWRSADKDNMEFTATITSDQMAAIRAIGLPAAPGGY